uniref:Uncharacterized protein n=1 Tax=Culex tarsalis TaxID=7177 RepID=A0A1Q3EUJ2_CULTA
MGSRLGLQRLDGDRIASRNQASVSFLSPSMSLVLESSIVFTLSSTGVASSSLESSSVSRLGVSAVVGSFLSSSSESFLGASSSSPLRLPVSMDFSVVVVDFSSDSSPSAGWTSITRTLNTEVPKSVFLV